MSFQLMLIFMIVFLGISFLRRKAITQLNNQLAQTIAQTNSESTYMRILESSKAKLVFTEFYRSFLRMNYYILNPDKEKMMVHYNQLINQSQPKIRNTDKLSVYRQAITFFAENNEGALAEEAFEQMQRILRLKDDPRNELFIRDIRLYLDIYVNKDISRLGNCLELIERSTNDETKSLYQFRAAKLYYYKGDLGKCRDYIEMAASNTKNEAYLTKLNYILEGHFHVLD